ncbi:creatininase family protein [Mycobacterium sp. 155]|uniref:creatininase family protein n=1 Tax=Mycobacterium sp. 155 TaxID=1157943 RepID=UPI00036D00C3|nr:creatininase family protein [Mycobacterium sp. 155]
MNSAYHRQVASPSELGNSTSRQLRNVSSMLVIPVGSTGQHGPHLPRDTDTRIASAVAGAAVERLDGVAGSNWILAPAIRYGAEHEGLAGTVSIGAEAVRLSLVAYGRSAMSWVSRLVFVNGHRGNATVLAAATGLLRSEGERIFAEMVNGCTGRIRRWRPDRNGMLT